MISNASFRAVAIIASGLATLLAPQSAGAAPVVVDSSWIVLPFATIPPSTPEGVSVDGAGRVYVSAGTAGVFQFDTTGAGISWSSAAGAGLATVPDGRTFVPSRGIFPTSYIWAVATNGTYIPLVAAASGEYWIWVAATSSGPLYALHQGGARDTIFAVDAISGAATSVFAGGPGAGGAGHYRAIAVNGVSVVVSGNDEVGFGVFELVGGVMTLFARTTQSMLGICAGPSGDIYAASGDASGGQVWKITPGSATLFAYGFGNTVSVAYDAPRNRIYVQDQSPPKIWVISRNPTAIRPVTIGRIHQLYR